MPGRRGNTGFTLVQFSLQQWANSLLSGQQWLPRTLISNWVLMVKKKKKVFICVGENECPFESQIKIDNLSLSFFLTVLYLHTGT